MSIELEIYDPRLSTYLKWWEGNDETTAQVDRQIAVAEPEKRLDEGWLARLQGLGYAVDGYAVELVSHSAGR